MRPGTGSPTATPADTNRLRCQRPDTIARMDTFLSWPGWAGVSGIAQLAALLAVVGALWRFVRLRGQIPLFYAHIAVLGTAKLVDGKQFHIVEFHNTGRSSAEVHLVECFGGMTRLEDGYVAPQTLASGATFKLLVTAPRISEVWFRVTWRTPDVRRRVTVGWWPISGGENYKKWARAARKWRFYRRAYRWFWPGAVGPDGSFRGWFHAWPWEDLHRITPVPKKPTIYSLGTFHNHHPTDLPYEDPVR